MAKLKAAQRKKLPSKSFVFPKTRQFPIHDKAHGRAALRLAPRSSKSTATVRRAVFKKFPSLKPKVAKGSTRKRSSSRRSTQKRRRR